MLVPVPTLRSRSVDSLQCFSLFQYWKKSRSVVSLPREISNLNRAEITLRCRLHEQGQRESILPRAYQSPQGRQSAHTLLRSLLANSFCTKKRPLRMASFLRADLQTSPV